MVSSMSQGIALYGKMLTFSRLKISTSHLEEIQSQLAHLLSNHPIANQLPIVIDSDVDLNLNQLIDALWSLNVQPIGVIDGILSNQAKALRLAIFPTDGKRIERLPNHPTLNTADNPPESDETTTAPKQVVVSNTQHTPTTQSTSSQSLNGSVHTQLLRSGQSLQHLGGDLTIVGGVNDGAEAITDHNLHIYGRGLGRLVAGATGDKDARIFCQKFNPSLVSVAGTYCLRESIPGEMIDQAVQVTYDESKGLVFTLLNQY